jgi:hypothetical protein
MIIIIDFLNPKIRHCYKQRLLYDFVLSITFFWLKNNTEYVWGGTSLWKSRIGHQNRSAFVRVVVGKLVTINF